MNVEDHITWAEVVASKYRNERNIPIEHEEVVSLGMVGLMMAARAYKEDKGKFRTYAWPRIRAEINDSIKKSMRRNDLTAMMVNLDTMPRKYLPSVNGTEKRAINKDLVERILESVEFDEAYALERYYLDGLRMHEIGIEMGVTLSRISQIITSGRERAKRIWAREI